jgi:hypothetical protein
VIISGVSVTTGRRATAPRAASTQVSDASPSDSVDVVVTDDTTARSPRHVELRLDVYDIFLVLALGVGTVLAHPVSSMLSRPYWLDESWVAVLTKAPIGRMLRMSSSAPVGFVALVRYLPDTAGGQRGRMVVLGFSVLTVAAAYVFVRTLAWTGRLSARSAALVAALVVMLAPVSLIRNDLKPYTCDAFVAVVLLAVAAWAERDGTRRSIVVLGIVAIAAVPFSSTTIFVVPVVLLGLLVAAGIDRTWQRVRDLVVGGAVIGGALVAYFAILVLPNLNDRLRAFWNAFYLRGSFVHTIAEAWHRLTDTDHVLGAPAIVLVGLFVVGVVVLTQLRARSVAVAMPLLWVEMIVVAHAQRYPFLDERTSQFLFVSSLVVVALGAVGVVVLLSRLWLTKHPLIGTSLAAVAAIALAAIFVADFRPFIHVLNIRPEDVRGQTIAVATRRQPHDVVIVNSAGDFGVAYYWPGHPHLAFPNEDTGQGFAAHVTGVNAIYVHSREYADVLAGMQQAMHLLRAAPRGSRLFIVRTHLNVGDPEIWHEVFVALHVKPREDVVGVEPLLVLDRSALGPA